MKFVRNRLYQYAYLMRWDKPVGIWLLLWPTLWALWFAAQGKPNLEIFLIFVSGVFLMRSAGCIVNDLVDQDFDRYVSRTKQRPLAQGTIFSWEAIILAGFLVLIAFLLVLRCNLLTILLSFCALLFTILYPFLKRMTYLPQLGLGVAFAWAIPMAFAAVTQQIEMSAWLLFLVTLLWAVIYDTMYAMVDREDDLKIGIKSIAILFGEYDKGIIALLQIIFIMLLMWVGMLFHRGAFYFSMLMMTLLFFCYQQWLIKNRDSRQCFQAFLNNHWVGMIIFIGIALDYLR